MLPRHSGGSVEPLLAVAIAIDFLCASRSSNSIALWRTSTPALERWPSVTFAVECCAKSSLMGAHGPVAIDCVAGYSAMAAVAWVGTCSAQELGLIVFLSADFGNQLVLVAALLFASLNLANLIVNRERDMSPPATIGVLCASVGALNRCL